MNCELWAGQFCLGWINVNKFCVTQVLFLFRQFKEKLYANVFEELHSVRIWEKNTVFEMRILLKACCEASNFRCAEERCVSGWYRSVQSFGAYSLCPVCFFWRLVSQSLSPWRKRQQNGWFRCIHINSHFLFCTWKTILQRRRVHFEHCLKHYLEIAMKAFLH